MRNPLFSFHAIGILLLTLACPATAVANSVEFFVNNGGAGNYDYGDQTNIPASFGTGEFTLELWIRPNNSFPVGPVVSGANQRENWADNDVAPYSSGSWWFKGNFLLDGHNNNSFSQGTFTLQFYGGGRVRWLFGDGSSSIPSGGVWSVGAYPASTTASLLDGAWHHLTLVRRWTGTSEAQLELWIDGLLVDTEISDSRADMRQWWTTWAGFPGNEEGWFWGAEKQAANGTLSQYEDYKGLLDELRFWSRAKSASEIMTNYADPVNGGETGLAGVYRFGEGQGTEVCDAIDTNRCIFLQNPKPGVWSTTNAPLTSGGGDTQAPTTPGNLQGTAVSSSRIDLTWDASTDNVGVTNYVVRRDGAVVATPSGTSYNDAGLAANTSYSYTVAAQDAAGNTSANSAAISVTTDPSSDTQAPTTPANVQGTAVSSSRIDLTWDASTDNVGVTNYVVRRDGAVVATPSGTSFSDTGLASNTSYSYTVAAQDAAGNVSASSQAISVTTNPSSDTQAPTTPTNVTATASSASSIRVTWSASTDNVGVTGYEVSRNGTVVSTVSGLSFTDTGLAAATSYSYTVVAIDGAGNRSGLSATATTTTLTASNPGGGGGGGGSFGFATVLLLLAAVVANRKRHLHHSLM